MKELINSILSENMVESTELLNTALADKISTKLSESKIEVAQSLFGGQLDEAKNPKIDLYHNGVYKVSTTRSPTVKHAVAGYKAAYPDLDGEIKGAKAVKESIGLDEAEQKTQNAKNWDISNKNSAARKSSTPEELYANFKAQANHPTSSQGKHNYSDTVGGMDAEQKAIHNISLGAGKFDKRNYHAMIKPWLEPKGVKEEVELDEASIDMDHTGDPEDITYAKGLGVRLRNNGSNGPYGHNAIGTKSNLKKFLKTQGHTDSSIRELYPHLTK